MKRSYPLTEILPYLERIRDRFTDPANRDAFKNFSKTLLFEFPDTRQSYLFTVVNGLPTLEEKTIAAPDIKLMVNTDILAGILDKKINPMMAYMTRKFKVEGDQSDLLQLQKLMF